MIFHWGKLPRDMSELGGKGANLVRLQQARAPVPPWFAVDARAFARFLKPIQAEIDAHLSNIDFADEKSILAASCAAQALITATALPVDLERAIRSRVLSDFPDGPVAVRSSGLAEDGADDSYAGQFDTFLHVAVEDVIPRIRACWASAFGARVLTYMHLRAGRILPMRMTVLVQQMVPARSAGVMFTGNPDGRLNEIVISAAYGESRRA